MRGLFFCITQNHRNVGNSKTVLEENFRGLRYILQPVYVFKILSIKNKLITSMSFLLSNKAKDFSVPLLPKPSPPFLSQPQNEA